MLKLPGTILSLTGFWKHDAQNRMHRLPQSQEVSHRAPDGTEGTIPEKKKKPTVYGTPSKQAGPRDLLKMTDEMSSDY